MKFLYQLNLFITIITFIQIGDLFAIDSPFPFPNSIEKDAMDFYIEKREKITDQHITLFKGYVPAVIFGRGGGCPDKITNISLSFIVETPSPLDVKKARQLIVKGSQDLLYRINRDKSLEPGLKNYPFNTSNIRYGFYFADKVGEIYVNEEGQVNLNRLTSCNAANGYIYYTINYDPSKNKLAYKETYEEALEIVRKERPDLLEPLKEGDRFED